MWIIEKIDRKWKGESDSWDGEALDIWFVQEKYFKMTKFELIYVLGKSALGKETAWNDTIRCHHSVFIEKWNIQMYIWIFLGIILIFLPFWNCMFNVLSTCRHITSIAGKGNRPRYWGTRPSPVLCSPHSLSSCLGHWTHLWGKENELNRLHSLF